MILVLSPSKTLDFETPPPSDSHTPPEFLAEAARLIAHLKPLSAVELARLMGISDKLAELNRLRFQNWAAPFTPENAKQALFAFKGDVYDGLQADDFDADDITIAQGCLRILSGLYGLLRPLDLIQPYRLEMGCRLPNSQGNNLYEFWGDRITEAVNEIAAAGPLINLASAEYFKAVKPKQLHMPVVTPVFQDFKSGVYKIIGFYAKVARGLMARFVIKNRIDAVDALKDFAEDGYRFDPTHSDAKKLVFRRKRAVA